MKRILFALLAALMLAMCANAAFERVNTYSNNFTDVTDTNWFAENVKTAYELGFMNGKSEGKFDPNGNVTVAEAITMAARVHAIYNGIDIENFQKAVPEIRYDFDDLENISFNNANGVIKNGILEVTPTQLANGGYDPGVLFQGEAFDARSFDNLKVRMKIDTAGFEEKRQAVSELYFKTSTAPTWSESRLVNGRLEKFTQDVTDWFEVEVDLSSNAQWADDIIVFRFDPSNDGGIYYIDYVVLSKSVTTSKWYDKYVDYATEKGILSAVTFTADDFDRNITRAELCTLFASSMPEEYFTPINDIKGIPDVDRSDRNADVFLALYKAGILLGSDSEGTFNPDSDIKRSEVAAIINRVALPENRVKGTISADWNKLKSANDIEFENDSYLDSLVYSHVGDISIDNGAISFTTVENVGGNVLYDPMITNNNASIDADKYTKLVVRLKPDFVETPEKPMFDFFFKPEGQEKFNEINSMHQYFYEFSYVDAFGWYVLEVDLTLNAYWKGNIHAFRFDPANENGTYKIDYIRFIDVNQIADTSHEGLVNAGYTATRLILDESFENGFYVSKFDQTEMYGDHGTWKDYSENDEAPVWGICPWWQPVDLYDDRDTTTDKYTLTDKNGISLVKYNPEEKSLTMSLNAQKIHEGKPHTEEGYKLWPHLLLDQHPAICEADRQRNALGDADKVFAEIDLRMLDFKNTTNTEGQNRCLFVAYYYLMTDKAPGKKIWFGLTFFEDDANEVTGAAWAIDPHSDMMMYRLVTASVYDGLENSFTPEVGVYAPSEEWKHIRLDLTGELVRAVEWANRDNSFGVPVTMDDMYIGGVNIGYEIWGNFDATFEFKNFNMITYKKAE